MRSNSALIRYTSTTAVGMAVTWMIGCRPSVSLGKKDAAKLAMKVRPV
jgi:hypothetical protein